jgi:hypothetical protein
MLLEYATPLMPQSARHERGTHDWATRLDKISDQTRTRFDSAFSRIVKNNHRAMLGHTRDGWEQVAEDEREIYVVYRFAQ